MEWCSRRKSWCHGRERLLLVSIVTRLSHRKARTPRVTLNLPAIANGKHQQTPPPQKSLNLPLSLQTCPRCNCSPPLAQMGDIRPRLVRRRRGVGRSGRSHRGGCERAGYRSSFFHREILGSDLGQRDIIGTGIPRWRNDLRCKSSLFPQESRSELISNKAVGLGHIQICTSSSCLLCRVKPLLMLASPSKTRRQGGRIQNSKKRNHLDPLFISLHEDRW